MEVLKRSGPQRAAPVDPFDTAAGEAILRHKQISDADKIAWRYLWKLSRGGHERIVVSGAMIAAHQGKTSRTGLTRLENLSAAHLLRIVERDEARGLYTIELLDVEDEGVLHSVKGDPQHFLEFASDATYETEATANGHTGAAGHASVVPFGSRACVGTSQKEPTQEPTQVPTTPTLHLESLNKLTSHLNTSSASEEGLSNSSATGPEGTCVGTFAADRGGGPQRIGSSIEALLAQPPPTPADRLATVNRLTNWIMAGVNCPQMVRKAAVNVAWDIVERGVPERDVQTILLRLGALKSQGAIQTTPSQFFNGAINKLYRRLGIPRQQQQPERRPPR